MGLIPIVASILLAASHAAPSSTPPGGHTLAVGHVKGIGGKPLAGASVCASPEGKEPRCVTTDEAGYFRMEDPGHPYLLVSAKGYKSQMILAAPQDTAIVLLQSAGLMVKVVDETTGEPVPKGTIALNLPSGLKVGNEVPFNKGGVKMSNLAPGDIMVRAQADHYAPSGPIPTTLVGGEQKELVVRIKKLDFH